MNSKPASAMTREEATSHTSGMTKVSEVCKRRRNRRILSFWPLAET